MPLVHVLGNGAYVSRSKCGRLAAMREEDGAWRDKSIGNL
jgi:hypothetical protein